MDSLTNLPVDENDNTSPQEQVILSRYFGDEKETSTSSSSMNWKLVGYTSLLFVLLANPWIDKLFEMIPYCGSTSYGVFGIKVLLFLFLLIIIMKFML